MITKGAALIICGLLSLVTFATETKNLTGEDVNSIVKTNFLFGESPIRYYSNILICLQGNPTSDDSLIFMELVDTLNMLIDKWDVHLIPKGTTNLNFEFGMPQDGIQANPGKLMRNNGNEIIQNKVNLITLNKETPLELRKKIIRYYFLRSLALFKPDPNLHKKIPGSVFAEKHPENITLHTADFQIIKKVYSSEYENRKKSSGVPLKNRQQTLKDQILMLSGNIMIIMTILFILLLLFKNGVFSNHKYLFKSYFKQGVIIFMAIFIYLIGGVIIVIKIKFNTPELFTSQFSKLGITALMVILFGLSSIILLYFCEKYVLENNDNLFFQVFFPLLTTTIVPSVLIIISYQIFAKNNESTTPLTTFAILISSISVLLFFSVIRALFIFFNKNSENIIHKKDVELAKLGELHKQAELQALQSRINPHFLYNALNTIAGMASKDAIKTEQMTLALSDFFKYTINREQKQFNELSEELNVIRTYLEIEKVRFGEKLSYTIDCPSEILQIHVPQLIIQPLVENAVKHGCSKITEPGIIKVTVQMTGNRLQIFVYDNGPAFPDGPLSGMGIQNTQDRIVLHYGEKAGIHWQNGENKHICITLPLTGKKQSLF